MCYFQSKCEFCAFVCVLHSVCVLILAGFIFQLNQVCLFMNTLICLLTMILTENRADALIHDYANKWLSSIFSCLL